MLNLVTFMADGSAASTGHGTDKHHCFVWRLEVMPQHHLYLNYLKFKLKYISLKLCYFGLDAQFHLQSNW